MIGVEQGLLYSLIIGVMIGVIWGIRKLYLLEKVIYRIDINMEKMLERIEEKNLKLKKK